MKKTLCFISACGFACALFAGARFKLLTPAEEKSYSAYTVHREVVHFLSRLQEIDPRLRVQVAGKTLERASENRYGRDILCGLVSDPRFPAASKLRVLLIASQHGDEQSGVEASLQLLKQIAEGRLDKLLERLDLIVFPQANPFGNEKNMRENEQGLDLNRDHSKLEAPETEALHRVFAELLPEVTFDMHEKGDDYYQVNVGTVTNSNIAAPIRDFSQKQILSGMEKELGEIPFHEYLIHSYIGDVSAAGARGPEPEKREPMMRYSTTDINDGRNSFGIFQTFSFIQEVASHGDELATYRERSGIQFAGLSAFLKTIYNHSSNIKALVAQCRSTQAAVQAIKLRTRYTRDPNEPVLEIKQFKENDVPAIGTAVRDIKKGERVSRSDIQRPERRSLVTEQIKNWFPRSEILLSRNRPAAYLFAAEREDVALLLARLGVQVYTLDSGGLLPAEGYRVDEVVPAADDYLAPDRIAVTPTALQLPVRKGDFYVPVSQPGSALICLLLEPESELGLLRYRSLKLVGGKERDLPLLSPEPGPQPAAGSLCLFPRLTGLDICQDIFSPCGRFSFSNYPTLLQVGLNSPSSISSDSRGTLYPSTRVPNRQRMSRRDGHR